jgi:hypothetical protein
MKDYMNISICRSYLLAFAMLLSIITPCAIIGNALGKAPSTTPQEIVSEQELHTLYQEALEPYFTRALAQMHVLDCMLQDLAFNLANNASISTKNRGQAIIKIRSMRELLTELKDTQIVILDEQLVNSFILITRATISHLTNGLKHGIDSLEVVDLNDIQAIQLKAKNGISLESLDKELALNDKLIKALAKLSDNLGLHWYNKVYRNLKRCVYYPAKAAAPWVLTGGTLSAAALCAWYYIGGENPKWLRDKLGWPQYNKDNHDESITKYNMQNQKFMNFLAQKHLDDETIKEAEGMFSALPESTKKAGIWDRTEQFKYRYDLGRYFFGGGVIWLGKEIINAYVPLVGRSIAKKIKSC